MKAVEKTLKDLLRYYNARQQELSYSNKEYRFYTKKELVESKVLDNKDLVELVNCLNSLNRICNKLYKAKQIKAKKNK